MIRADARQASAPAKAILLGEHAVVYGQPAIAVPVSGLRAYATVHPNPSGGLRIAAGDLDIPVNIDAETVDHALALTARLALKALGTVPPDATITIRSDIPIASGLGSGAAVSTALARALCAALGQEMDNETLNSLIYEVEKIHHGTPSGIDNTVIVYERPVYFVRGQPIETLTIAKPFTLLIGDTGKSASTREAVADVRELYERDTSNIQTTMRYIRHKVWGARDAIEHGDLEKLGKLMSKNHLALQSLTVSSPELDALVEAAHRAGALGAKLSGGGRGGNMIALVTPETRQHVEKALYTAGAVHVYAAEVG
jgi:mevalonate kinase